MKKVIAPLVLSTLLVTACAPKPDAPISVAPHPNDRSASASPSQAEARKPAVMPNVAGRSYGDVNLQLRDLGIYVTPIGSDGSTFDKASLAEVTVKSSSIPAGQTVPESTVVLLTLNATEKSLAAKAEADELAKRYVYSCGTQEYTVGEDATKAHTQAELWKSPHAADFKKCDVEIDGQPPYDLTNLLPSEQSIVSTVAKNGGDVSNKGMALANVLTACAMPPANDWERSAGPGNKRVKAVATAALALCPSAPFASELKRVSDGIPPASFEDGRYVVGKDIQVGTYQVQGTKVSNCYWERTDSAGNTIANDFITFAPQGPVVSIGDGEGFVSERCGSWVKVG